MARVFLAAVAAAVLASAAARVINLDDSSFQRAVGESSEWAKWRPWRLCGSCTSRTRRRLHPSVALNDEEARCWPSQTQVRRLLGSTLSQPAPRARRLPPCEVLRSVSGIRIDCAGSQQGPTRCCLDCPSPRPARGLLTWPLACPPPPACVSLPCPADGARTAKQWPPRWTRCLPLLRGLPT